MPVKWIEHKGRKILYADYRKQNPAEMRATLEESAKAIGASATKVLWLANFEGTSPDREFMARSKELGAKVLEPNTARSAIVGVDGLKAILLKGYNLVTGGSVTPCKDEAAAKNYLVA